MTGNRGTAPLVDRMRLVVRTARVTMIDDSVSPPVLQIVTPNGETENGIRYWQPYGIRSRAVAGSQTVLNSFGGFRRNTMASLVTSGVADNGEFADGDVALIDYRGLRIRLAAAGIIFYCNGLPVTMTDLSKLRVEGAIEATGEITANVDSAPIALSTHLTSDVAAGSDTSGPPVAP